MKRRYRVACVVLLALMCAVAIANAADQPAGFLGPKPVPLGELTAALYVYALQIVGLAIFVMFLIAGLAYMVPALQKTVGNPIQIMQDAVIGLVILVSAYVILNSIHPDIVTIDSSSSQTK